jgi:diguanylate cyclase (GGDEF)-like protein/PAS domain S-box-containing protein
MPQNWFKKTIARKLLLAFFSVFLFTYVVTSVVVQSAIQTALTDSEIAALSQLAHLKLNSFDARFEQLSIDLRAWAKLDVMNDIVSDDVDKRVERTLGNLKKDYAIKGQLYAFNTDGHLVASSEPQQHKTAMLPDAWKPHGGISFVNKHTSPLDGDDIVALVVPVTANFLANYPLGTLVMTYHWDEINAALPEQALLLYHQNAPAPLESAKNIQAANKSLPYEATHQESIILLGSTLGTTVPNDALANLTHLNGWTQVGNNPYLAYSVQEDTGLLSGWEIVMLRDPASLYQTSHMAMLKLTIFGMILALPLIFVIRWLARRITAPLIQLTQFVSEITGTHDLSRRLELDSDDEIGVLAADFNHMTARLESESRAHREAEARLRATINNALDAVVQINTKGIITGWNTQAENIFGWAHNEAVGQLLHEMIIPPQYRENHLRGMQNYQASGEGPVLNSRIELTSLHRDGREFPVELAITAIEVEGRTEFSAFIRDITHKKESADIIWKQANFDKITGLPNRHMLHDRLEQEIKKAHRVDLQMGLLFIDLDRFKEINDTLGHDMGDILLMETSRRISSCVRESDTVARLGGDEFTVILSEIDDTKIVERAAQAILKILAEPFQLGDEVAYISASIGITLYPNDAASVEELLKNADQAMYVAKNLGRNQSSYFTAALQNTAQERRRLIHDLRGALASNQFRVYFQPIMDLATGHIHKAEALIRWQHPEHGMIGPMEFIPLAEETGLINEIGSWVFQESAHWAKRWRDQFAHDFQISVNVSPVQFLSVEHSCNTWDPYLKSIDLAGQHIVIEITEGLLLKASTVVTDMLLQFRDAGIQVAIDDFGTGYSSLSYLKKFDIDYLKIDKSFVDNLETDTNDMALSEAIIMMAHKLGLKVIAEGVESEAQCTILRNAGCDYAQGYLISKPVPPEAFEALLKASAQGSSLIS